MRRILFIICVLFCCSTYSYTQEIVSNSKRGYIIKDKDTFINGIAIENANKEDRAHKVVIPSQQLHEGAVYYPDDILGYGFSDDLRYFRATINLNGIEKIVFLEEIINMDNKISVYYYPDKDGDKYYLQQDDEILTLIQENDTTLWSILKNNSACPEFQALESFPQKIDGETIRIYYNVYKRCNANIIPKIKFGLAVGLGLGKPSINDIPVFNFAPAFNFNIGAFLQIPLDECFSLNPELKYSNSNNRSGVQAPNPRTMLGKSSFVRHSIQLPVMVKYSFNYTNGNIIPFLELGIFVDYSFNSKRIAKEMLFDINGMSGNNSFSIHTTPISKVQFGGVLGAGIEYKFTPKQSLYLSLRANYSEGRLLDLDDTAMKLTVFHLNAAISF